MTLRAVVSADKASGKYDPAARRADATGATQRRCVVYGLQDPDTQALRYIGRTCDLPSRLRDHAKGRRGGAALREWLRSLDGPPPYRVLFRSYDGAECEERERELIAQYREAGADLLNVGHGGEAGRYDHGLRRRATRVQRQRGVRVYIPMEELEKAGFSPDAPPPFYRVWGSRRGSVLVRLYREA